MPDAVILARRKQEGALSTQGAAKVIRLALVIERAEQVFEFLEASLD